jgi:hypothetical protein
MKKPVAGVGIRRWGMVSCVLLAAFPWPSAAAAGETLLVGWIERVTLEAERIPITAKLDTGADISSLHASSLHLSRREGARWVAFEVVGENGQHVRFQRKVVRMVSIKRASGIEERRPAVMLGICLGDTYRVTEVNLVDRSGLSHELLVGRNFLSGRFAVDSAREFTVGPHCEQTHGR